MTSRELDDLLNSLTFEEKLAQLGSVMVTDLMTGGQLDGDKLRDVLRHGLGQVARPAALGGRGPRETAELTNEIQRAALEHLRIPVLFHDEALAGLLAKDATTFPQSIGLGCMWEPELVGAMAATVGEQARAVGVRLALAPVLDVARDPRWGRIEETYGEDPLLVAQCGAAYVKALQGELQNGVAATGKHFLGHAQPQGGRNWAPSNIPERELREVHLTPFRAAVQAGLAAVMTTYHSRDGIPSAADAHLTNEVLRGELGFDGAVVSDYYNTKMLLEYHHVARDAADASAQTLLAGTDAELPYLEQFAHLGNALSRGLVTQEVIDEAVRRVLTLKNRLGLFENPFVDAEVAPRHFGTPAQQELTRTLAQKSVVLLKNEGRLNESLLPLRRDLARVAVIGPAADSRRLLQGDYHFPSHLEDFFISKEINPDSPNPQAEVFTGPMDDYFPPSVTVFGGVRAAVSADTRVVYAEGCDVTGDDESGIAAAVAAAQDAEVAVVVVGERSGMSSVSTCGEARDRATLGLLGVQQALVEAVCATGTPTVVVLLSGRPLALPWLAEHANALLYAGVPAQEGGSAVADVLFGLVNPGGKLCATFPRSVGQVPLHSGLSYAGGRSNWHGEYVDSPVTPLYPFGHGLSYTQFSYSGLELGPDVPVGETLTLSVELENSGGRAGEEVVQLYARVQASVVRPAQQLVGFKRVYLEPGERARLTFTLDTRLLAFYDRDLRFVLEPGEVELTVGSSSADIRLRGAFTLSGETRALEAAPLPGTPVLVEKLQS